MGLLDVVVDEEAPESHLLVLPPAQGAAVDVGAHFNGHLEFYTAGTEEGEEQPRVEGGELAVVVELSAADAAVLEGGGGGEAEDVVGERLEGVGDEERAIERELDVDPGELGGCCCCGGGV